MGWKIVWRVLKRRVKDKISTTILVRSGHSTVNNKKNFSYLNNAQSIVNRSFHFITIEIIGAAQDYGAGSSGLGTLHQDQLVIGDPRLADLSGLAQIAGLEGLVALQVGETGHECSTCFNKSILACMETKAHKSEKKCLNIMGIIKPQIISFKYLIICPFQNLSFNSLGHSFKLLLLVFPGFDKKYTF